MPKPFGRASRNRNPLLAICRCATTSSSLSISQLVIDIASELASRRGERFEDYTETIRTLAGDPRFSPALIDALARLPGFRNVVVHEYVALDLGRVIDAMDHLSPVEEFFTIVREIEASH